MEIIQWHVRKSSEQPSCNNGASLNTCQLVTLGDVQILDSESSFRRNQVIVKLWDRHQQHHRNVNVRSQTIVREEPRRSQVVTSTRPGASRGTTWNNLVTIVCLLPIGNVLHELSYKWKYVLKTQVLSQIYIHLSEVAPIAPSNVSFEVHTTRFYTVAWISWLS